MVFLAFILIVVVLPGLMFLFRAAGSMQRPTAEERRKHSKTDQHGPGPRSTGLN